MRASGGAPAGVARTVCGGGGGAAAVARRGTMATPRGGREGRAASAAPGGAKGGEAGREAAGAAGELHGGAERHRWAQMWAGRERGRRLDGVLRGEATAGQQGKDDQRPHAHCPSIPVRGFNTLAEAGTRPAEGVP